MDSDQFNILATVPVISPYKEDLNKFAKLNVLENPERRDVLSIIEKIDAVLAGDKVHFDEELFKTAGERLKVISRVGVGYDNVDIDMATKHGIMVTNTPGVMAESVAEHTILLMLAIAKDLVLVDRETRQGNWGREKFRGIELWTKTLGQIGLGCIGYQVASKARKALNMNVMVHDPYVAEERILELGGKSVKLDTLLEKSDVVTINCPLTDDTYKLIGRKELEQMKEDALLINTARGEVIDEQALINALNQGIIAKAGLDVFEEEPLSADNPLTDMDDVILTSHQSSNTKNGVDSMFREAIRNLKVALEGKEPRFLIS